MAVAVMAASAAFQHSRQAFGHNSHSFIALLLYSTERIVLLDPLNLIGWGGPLDVNMRV